MKTFQSLTLTLLTTLALTTNVSAATELTLNASTADVTVSSDLIADTIHKTGANKITLTGTNTIGNLDIQAGTVSVAAVGAIKVTPAAVSFSGADGGTLAVTATTGVINADVTAKSGNFDIANGTTTTLSSLAGGSGKTLTKTGSGTLNVTGNNSATAAGIIVNAGTLLASTANSLTALTTLNGGTLELANTVTTARAIAMTAASNISVGTGETATLGGDQTKLTGIYALTKTGAGVLTLNGTKSASQVPFIITDGMVTTDVVSELPAGDGASPLTLNGANAILQINGAMTIPVAITLGASGGTLDVDAAAIHDKAINGTTTLKVTGNNVLTLSTIDRSADTAIINVDESTATVKIGAATDLPGAAAAHVLSNGGELEVSAGLTLPTVLNIGTSGGVLDTGAGLAVAAKAVAAPFADTSGAASGILTVKGSGSLTLHSSNNLATYTGIKVSETATLVAVADANLPATTTLNGGSLKLDSGVESLRTIALIAASGITVDDAETATLTGTLSGTFNLTKANTTGKLILSGNKAASTTAITVAGGTLQVGADNNFPAAGAGVTINSGATLKTTAEITTNAGPVTMNSGSILDLGGNWGKAITVA